MADHSSETDKRNDTLIELREAHPDWSWREIVDAVNELHPDQRLTSIKYTGNLYRSLKASRGESGKAYRYSGASAAIQPYRDDFELAFSLYTNAVELSARQPEFCMRLVDAISAYLSSARTSDERERLRAKIGAILKQYRSPTLAAE